MMDADEADEGSRRAVVDELVTEAVETLADVSLEQIVEEMDDHGNYNYVHIQMNGSNSVVLFRRTRSFCFAA